MSGGNSQQEERAKTAWTVAIEQVAADTNEPGHNDATGWMLPVPSTGFPTDNRHRDAKRTDRWTAWEATNGRSEDVVSEASIACGLCRETRVREGAEGCPNHGGGTWLSAQNYLWGRWGRGSSIQPLWRVP